MSLKKVFKLNLQRSKYFQKAVIDYKVLVIDYQCPWTLKFKFKCEESHPFTQKLCVIDYTNLVIDYQWLFLIILLYPHSQSIKGLIALDLCHNTLEGTSFVVQVEGTSTWVWLRTREGTSLVDLCLWKEVDKVERNREDRGSLGKWR